MVAFGKLIRMQNEYLYKIKHNEIHNICHIDAEISMGCDTTGEVLNTTIRQLLMDEVDLELEQLFQAIECTTKEDTDRALSTEPNQDICKYILDNIEIWMEHKVEQSDQPKAYRKNDNVKIFTTALNQQNNQQQVKFGAYAKSIVKKFYDVNPNEATDNFDYAPSRPEKQRITVLHAAVVAPPSF
jgi:hypothetical protein